MIPRDHAVAEVILFWNYNSYDSYDKNIIVSRVEISVTFKISRNSRPEKQCAAQRSL